MNKPLKPLKRLKKTKETKEIEEVLEKEQDTQKLILEQLKSMQNRLDSVEEENKLLNQQVSLQNKVDNAPLNYANPKAKIEAPNVIPSYSARLLKMMEEDDEMVTGRFEYKEITRPKEARGATVSFFFRKYPGKPVMRYTLTHNKMETIPLGVAKHINGNLGGCVYNIHGYVMPQRNSPLTIDLDNPIIEVTETVHRLGFVGTEYM